ncbi:MAG: metallophosphoesterase family protein [Bacteroidales bacterium]
MSSKLNLRIKSQSVGGKKSFRDTARKIIKSSLVVFIAVGAFVGGCKKDTTDPPVPNGETLRFVFLADSRGDSMGYPVDTTALNPIIRQIAKLSPPPSFVMFGGDMSYRGYMNSVYTFQAWKDMWAPLGSGIPLYTAIGNHELYHHHASYGSLLVNQQEYQKVFSENPTNGPAGYDHLAYSFTSPGGNSFFAVLDPYFVSKDTMHLGLGGHIEDTQMSWLKAQVAQTTATHKFLFIHTPYYYVSDDPEEPSAADTTLTKLWSFADVNKFDIYACGHSHLYSRKAIDSSLPANPPTKPPTPAWKNNVIQLLNGTCGAGPSTGVIDPAIKTAWNVHNDDKTYYFSVIDINGNTVKVNSYGGNKGTYSVIDAFTITR